jgi:hypothetical protein
MMASLHIAFAVDHSGGSTADLKAVIAFDEERLFPSAESGQD